MLKQWCVRCGNQHHPAALVIHHWQHHGEHSQWATQLKFQIVACLLKLQEQDMQCSFCGLMINPPLQPGTTMEPERFVNMQTHFASNCPVVHQTALLLQPIYGRVTDGARSTRSRAAGVVSIIRPTASSGQPIQARQGRRTAIQKSQARSRTRRKRSQHDPPANPGRHDGHDEGDGHLDPTTRKEHTASSSSRLIHLLLSNQSSRCSTGANPVSSGLEEPEATESRQSGDSHDAHLPVSGHDQRSALESSKDGEEPQGRGSLGQGHSAGHLATRRLLDLPEVESRGETVPAAKTALPMDRLLRQLQHMEDILEDTSHVVRFHSLKAQAAIVPWYLQISMRQEELWLIFGGVATVGNVEPPGLIHESPQPIPIQTSASFSNNVYIRMAPRPRAAGKGKNSGKHKTKWTTVQPANIGNVWEIACEIWSWTMVAICATLIARYRPWCGLFFHAPPSLKLTGGNTQRCSILCWFDQTICPCESKIFRDFKHWLTIGLNGLDRQTALSFPAFYCKG